jgi:hypothetical protein
MQFEKLPVHKGVHNVHAPFGRTNTQLPLPGPPQAAIRGKSSKKIQLRHVVTTTLGHE